MDDIVSLTFETTGLDEVAEKLERIAEAAERIRDALDGPFEYTQVGHLVSIKFGGEK